MTNRTYRPRRVPLPDGGTLALRIDGSIDHLDAADGVVDSLRPTDPGWSQRAIRFGIRTAPETIHPSGRDVPDSKPPA